MLSKFVSSMAVRQAGARRLAPLIVNKQLMFVSQRGFLDRLGLESHTGSEVAVDTKGGEVSLW